jgi:hypothetical protein
MPMNERDGRRWFALPFSAALACSHPSASSGKPLFCFSWWALSPRFPNYLRFIVSGCSGAGQQVTFSPESPTLHLGSASRVL